MPIKGIKGGVGTKALGYGLGAEKEASDPNFNQTVLLLHGDGSEGEGNTAALGDPNYKAFRDNSTSAHALAVAGDAYGNDFSPYYYADGYWSVSFADATSDDDIEFAGANITLDGEFCFECFYSNLDFGSTDIIFSSDVNDEFQVYINSSEQFGFNFGGSSSAKFLVASGTSLGVYNHFVVTRDSSNNVRGFVNGVLKAYATGVTGSQNLTDLHVGSQRNNDHFTEGYISNLKLVEGSIPTSYQTSETGTGTSCFTIPTAPITTSSQGTTSSDVKLLTCQSNRFVDNSSSNLTPTISNNPKISTNTPFTQSKTANVGSGFFDGNTDNLTTTGSSDFAFGTGDYTFEAWVYPFSLPSVAVVLDLRYSNNNNADNISALTLFNATLGNYSGGNYSAGTDIPVIINQWNHIAIQRISGTQYYAVNGKVSSTTSSLTNNLNNASQRATIGGNVDQTTISMYTGYIADLRVVNGTGVYGTSDFDVPTTSLTAVTNTKLLTCQYSGAVRNVGFLDDSKYNHQITRNGHVYLGTFSPFSLEEGYWSAFFKGADASTVTAASSSDFVMGTGDFTIEFFALFLDTGAGGFVTVEATNGMAFYYTGSYFTLSKRGASHTEYVKYTHTPTLNTWHHIAVCRSGTGSNETALFFNGSRVAQSTNSEDYTVQAALNIGSIPVANYGFNGHLSNVRIVKGSSVYDTSSSSITVPTAPLTAVTNTKLLTCQSNRFIDNSTSNHTITISNTPKVQPFSPFKPTRSYSKDVIGGSAYFDGDTDYLSIPDSELFTLGTENFTIECWVYFNSVSGTQYVYGQSHSSSASDTAFQLYISSGTLYAWTGHGSASATVPKANEWVHLAFVRQGANVRIYYNGVQQDSTNIGASNALTNSTGVFAIGRVGAYDGDYFAGYISNFNFVKGVCKYDDGTAFDPPTAPITAHANTIFLANFTNAGIIDHTMKNNLDTVNNVRIRTNVKKFGTGSIYFDGSDSIRWNQTNVQNEGMAIGTGPFTIEFFVYFDGDPNNGGTNGQASLIRDAGGSLVIQRYDGEWEAGNESTPQIQVAQSLSNQTWYHVAMTRDSSANLKLFINGTQAGSTATSHTTDFSKNEWHLGALNADASGGRALTGYMDEIRIIAGVALYTSNFTAPTESFANR